MMVTNYDDEEEEQDYSYACGFFYPLYYPFREIRAALPGQCYSSRNGI